MAPRSNSAITKTTKNTSIKTHLIGSIKDKLSLIKATFGSSLAAGAAIDVLRATSHDPSTSPSSDDDLHLSLNSLPTLLSRLRRTRNSIVALKCLLAIHRLVSDQITDTHFLNLSKFKDPDSIELSSWVRWYAAVIEETLIVSRSIGFRYSVKSGSGFCSIDPKDRILGVPSSELVRELAILVQMAEEIGKAPASLECQKIGLVYEAMKLVGEEYRITMREVAVRVGELRDRVGKMGVEGLTEFGTELDRLVECREKLILIFLNKKRNDGVWDLVEETRNLVRDAIARMKETRIVLWI